ncbi:MAG TPA: hypothetical protein VFY05_07850 [Candidatus Angelobacter sp.]|nr:hypothetical protein [Candidatus Angelobacter sp.]
MAKRKTVAKRSSAAKRKAVAKPKVARTPKAVAKRKKIVAKSKARQGREKRSTEERIEELKRRAKELSGGEMQVETLDDCPEETEEAFWKHVVDYEEAPWTTNFQQLENAGVSLPRPESLNDEELTAKLREVIQKLALLHVYIEQTDHLSDRELYTHLWTESLREETKAMPLSATGGWHIQILGGCSEEDNQLYLKYYADEDWRRQWHKDFPRDSIPVHEDPPYDRDRLLPKANYNEPTGGEPS